MSPTAAPLSSQARRAWALMAFGPALLVVCNLLWPPAILLGGFNAMFRLVGPVYSLNTLWLPSAMLPLTLLALWQRSRSPERGRRQFFACLGTLGLALALFGLNFYMSHWEPHRLVVREVEIRSPKIAKPIRLVHVTDIQTGAVTDYERRVIERIREAKPDMLIFTGDLVQPVAPATFESELAKIFPLLESIEAPLGKFAVIGDVDAMPTWIALDGGEGGLKLLNNEAATIHADGATFRLFGLELLASAGRGAPVLAGLFLQESAPGDFTILFGHRPDFILQTKDFPIDLNLAGHTHGGQIRLPFIGPLVTLSAVPVEWARGYREVGATRLNVSAGIGCERALSLPKMRFNCPPEFTIIDLLPAKEGASDTPGE